MFALQVTRTGNPAAGAPNTAGSPSVPGSTQTSTLSYFHHDHLGSIAAISDETGKVVERLAYDPWGKRRYPDGASDVSDSLTGQRTDRGYTEHEHLDEMGVIHMNGRVYDPLIGRMMSADASIPDPYGLQSFNRYSYVYNNPLKLFDPTGFEPWGSTSEGSTQFSDTGNGTVSNTYTGDVYTYSRYPASGGASGNAVAASNVYGADGGGTTPIATYTQSSGNWTLTKQGAELAGQKWYSFPTLLAIAAAAQNKPYAQADVPVTRSLLLAQILGSTVDAGQKVLEAFLAFLPAKALAYLTGAKGAKEVAKSTVQILEREGNIVVGVFKVANGEAREIAEMIRDGDRLILNGAHIEGAGTLKEALNAAKAFGREQGAKEVVIQGGIRTTGANPGHAPRPISIKVN